VAGSIGAAVDPSEQHPTQKLVEHALQPKSQPKPKAPAPKPAPKPQSKPTVDADQIKQAPEAKPDMTTAQNNAVQAAQDYLDTMAMSKQGLIELLSSSAGDGYARADATFAVSHVDADWNKEAVEAARDYLDTVPMSGAELTQQLSSSAGDGFTLAQATYAVSKVGL
jgi:outer membrane biosynthesis protein TonB